MVSTPGCVAVGGVEYQRTLGAFGAAFCSSNSQGYLPAFRVDVVDTTAAGDAFCGAFAAAINEDMPLEQALRFANAAGALATTCRGAQPSLPKRCEIEKLVNSLP